MWRSTYQPLTCIQQTSRASVYRGRDQETDVRVKIYAPHALEAASRELAVLQAVRNQPTLAAPTLLKTQEDHQTGDMIIVTNWLPGKSLNHYLHFTHRAIPCNHPETCPLPEHFQCHLNGMTPDDALSILYHAAQALAQLHTLTSEHDGPLYHGDLAPANLLWDGTRTFLIDFGSDGAKHRFFRAPEGVPSQASDVYELWRLVTYLAPDLAERYPEFLSETPAFRPSMARLATTLRRRTRPQKVSRRQILSIAATGFLAAAAGLALLPRDAEHQTARQIRTMLHQGEGDPASLIDILSRKTNSTQPKHLKGSFIWLDSSTPRTVAVLPHTCIQVGDWVACTIDGQVVRGVFRGADLVAATIQAPGQPPIEYPWPDPHHRWVHRSFQPRPCEARPCRGGNLQTIVTACASIYDWQIIGPERLAGASILGRFTAFTDILHHARRLGIIHDGYRLMADQRHDLRILDQWDRSVWYNTSLLDALDIIALDTGLTLDTGALGTLDRTVTLGSVDLHDWFRMHAMTCTIQQETAHLLPLT